MSHISMRNEVAVVSMSAGWYPNGDDWETYWDGTAWTDQHRQKQPTPPPPPPTPPVATATAPDEATAYSADGALMSFKSHINGKNADVQIFRDRIEWKMARGVSGGKLTAGVLTGGASLLVTGVKNGKAGTEMIPMKAISGVTTKRDGMINTVVTVTSSSQAIGFRVSHKEAEQIRGLLNQLVLAA